MLPAPLNLLEYRLFRVKRRKRTEMFAGCRRADDRGVTHFDIRWNDGVLKFTGKLEALAARVDKGPSGLAEDGAPSVGCLLAPTGSGRSHGPSESLRCGRAAASGARAPTLRTPPPSDTRCCSSRTRRCRSSPCTTTTLTTTARPAGGRRPPPLAQSGGRAPPRLPLHPIRTPD